MRYKTFYPGDKVLTIVDYCRVPMGTAGTIASKYAGTAYVVRLADGTFRYLSDRSLASPDPSRHYALVAGDIGVIISEAYQDFARVGDLLQVFKVAYDVDYYGVLINGNLHWLGGFQLAKY